MTRKKHPAYAWVILSLAIAVCVTGWVLVWVL